MSENIGTLLVLWAYLLTYLALKKDNNKFLAVAALLLGLAVSTRVALILFAAVLAATFLINHRTSLRQNFNSSLVIAVCFLAGAAPFFIQNWMNFGNPLASGYAFWMPGVASSFTMDAFSNSLTAMWQELSLQRDTYVVANIFGTGTHFTPVYFLVCLAALLQILLRPSREKLVFVGSILVTIIVLASFNWIHLRKFYPHQVLSICLVANFYQISIDSALGLWRKYKLRASAIGILCLVTVGLSIAGYPSQTGWAPGESKIQFVDLLNAGYLGAMDNRYEPIRRFPSYLDDKNALVIVQTRNVNVLLATSLLPENMTVIPEDGTHRFQRSRYWTLGNQKIDQYTLDAYANNFPIYYVGANNEDVESLGRISDLIPGSEWQTLEQDKLVYLACLHSEQGHCPPELQDPISD